MRYDLASPRHKIQYCRLIESVYPEPVIRNSLIYITVRVSLVRSSNLIGWCTTVYVQAYVEGSSRVRVILLDHLDPLFSSRGL